MSAIGDEQCVENFRKRFVYNEETNVRSECSGNAKIYLAQTLANAPVAIKKINISCQKNMTIDVVQREIETHRQLSTSDTERKFIAVFVDGCCADGVGFIAMHWYKHGSLYLFLVKYFEDGLFQHLTALADTLESMLHCMQFLHAQRIVHRDIKPDNFLIADDCSLRLCDFGYTGHASGEMRCGTLNYMAPELFRQRFLADERTDMWAFGISAYEVAYGETPWSRHEDDEIVENMSRLQKYRNETLPLSFQHCPPLNDMLERCLRVDKEQRASVEILLNERLSPLCYATEKCESNGARTNQPINFILSTLSE